ncbi:MAG: Txe/YoeB family addiction module toxin [Saprospiraceae bacterium]|nr:Txe/YoeB family addiction module toxin [Saprospiraceae bacterium]MBK6565513.1 Txe/YoeB family addiction module toxin [Saprospiraceae bacterium]MBK6785627.1 Txe/YoeB family addiction module toxin [Saprospiraceae bacterium]MBK8081873.1 Txe/YoeB family addiction module toxin [Saprospiraceae bacterium]MBK8370597.1 Txe/YoeB family addiction module toxin [Saprospiraceae bacterium]
MSYFLDFTDKAKQDIDALQKAGNKVVLNKLFTLLVEISEHPFTGTGRPELLKHSLSGCWSRRINREHRLVYNVDEGIINILSVRGHYL